MFQGKRGLTDEERFFAYVEKTDTCWFWSGRCDADGYGLFWSAKEQKQVRAHRWSFEHHNGPLGRDLACHECDNPTCVRPDHLFAGTAADNNNDKASKGRTLGFAAMKGDRHTQAKLNSDDVARIKVLLLSRVKQKEVANQFNVDASIISKINSGKIWNHVNAA